MDRRIVKTREAIQKAYMELVIEKGSSRINISELARRANIDRKTFYLHYASPDDVLIEHVEKNFNMVASAEEKGLEHPKMKKLIELLDRFYKEEEKLLLVVAGSDTYDDLWRKVHNILADKTVALYSPHVNISKEEIIVFYDFFSAGVIDVYRRWVRKEYSCDLHYLVEMIGRAARTGLDPFMKR